MILFASIVLILLSATNDIAIVAEFAAESHPDTPKLQAQANRTLTYRCRAIDECGGFGDRMAGIMGSIFYATATQRKFYIHWPELQEVFHSDQYSDGSHLLLTEHEATVVQEEAVRVEGVYTRILTPVISRPDIAVVDTISIRAFAEFTSQELSAMLEQATHLLFHTNRGPTVTLFQRSEWDQTQGVQGDPDDDLWLLQRYQSAYREAFSFHFQVSPKLLESTYTTVDGLILPFRELLAIVEDPSVQSLSYHHRISDQAVRSHAPHNESITEEALEQLIALAQQEVDVSRRMVLFFHTNCPTSAERVLQSSVVRAAFQAVYIQQLTGVVHLSLLPTSAEAYDQRVQSLQQAARDWLVMRVSDILVCQVSHFCLTAGLLGAEDQVHYGLFTEGLVYLSFSDMCLDTLC